MMEAPVILDQVQKFEENLQMRVKILALEEALGEVPGAVFGDSDEFPLEHSFADGNYVRQITIPKGSILISKIHRYSHPAFILEGDITVVSEDGNKRMKAPCHFISKAGAKRVGFAHEKTVWVTVHATKETDLEKIEDEVISPSFEEFERERKQICLG